MTNGSVELGEFEVPAMMEEKEEVEERGRRMTRDGRDHNSYRRKHARGDKSLTNEERRFGDTASTFQQIFSPQNSQTKRTLILAIVNGQ